MFVVSVVLSGRGLCDGLITRPEESYRLWRVVVCDHETWRMRRLKPATELWKIQPRWVVTPGKRQQTTRINNEGEESEKVPLKLSKFQLSVSTQIQLACKILKVVSAVLLCLAYSVLSRTCRHICTSQIWKYALWWFFLKKYTPPLLFVQIHVEMKKNENS